MTRFVEIAGCPCPATLAPYVREVMRRTGVAPVAIYRGDEPEALRILHRNRKHSQRELREAWEQGRADEFGIRGIPNLPGQSTHELRSDGRAFAGPVGRRLPEIQCGMDWPRWAVAEVKAAFRALGCAPIHPYPGTTEDHHLCCTREGKLSPTIILRTDPIHPGDRGQLVRNVQLYLKRGRYLDRDFHVAKKVGTYGPVAVLGVKRFQRRVGLAADGIVGPKTYAALRRRYGWRVWRRRKARRERKKR